MLLDVRVLYITDATVDLFDFTTVDVYSQYREPGFGRCDG